MDYTELCKALEEFGTAFDRLDREWEQIAINAEDIGNQAEENLAKIMNRDYPFDHTQGEDFTDLADRVQLWCREARKALKVIHSGEQKAEVIYTGGGIWISAKHISDHVYAVVDNDFDECITYYDDREENEKYACQNMVESKGIDEMGVADRAVWEELHTALIGAMN